MGFVLLQAGALCFVVLGCLLLFALDPAGWHQDVWRHGIGVVALVLGLLGYGLAGQIRLRVAAQRAAEAATAAAAEAAAQYRLLADNSTDMILRLDLAFICRYLSPACREILGYEPAALVGTASISLLHPDDSEPLAEIYRAMAAGREAMRRENRSRSSARFATSLGVSLPRKPCARARPACNPSSTVPPSRSASRTLSTAMS